ncbi:MAG: sigma-70 family RNA polymerase sigma factor [Bacteroidales bacterium]|nr:sigma-70 family RNA polymerase sigma factor [Bacteroidales bacterium]
MSEKDIIDALIAHDEYVTEQFFFKNCRPLFMSIIRNVFTYNVDYDEFVNEFYLHLMENNAYRLRQFQGRSTIYQWLKVIAIRYFIAKRDGLIENESNDTLLESIAQTKEGDCEKAMIGKMDIENLLSLMPNKRYVYVIKRLLLEDAEPKVVAEELNTSVDNLYNIKKRAFATLTAIALREVERYEKEIGKK